MKKTFAPLFLLLILSGCVPPAQKWYRSPLKKTQGGKKYRRGTKAKTTVSPATPFEEELDSFILLDDFDEEFEFNDGLMMGSYEDIYLDDDDEITFVDDRDIDIYDFKTAYYDFDRYSIRADQQAIFEHNLNALKKAAKDGKTIVIEGHADSAAGTRAYNLQLSQKRAQTAADWFIERGIPERSIKVIGRGSEMLIVPYGDRSEQAPNRRVEIYTISA